MVSTRKPRAREYLRVSHDKSGRARSVEEQHQDHQRDAREHGWTLGAPYADIGSASRYAAKARGGFDRLITDLRAGRYGADLLLVWESSRGSRRVGEWVTLVELCEHQGVRVWVHTHGRIYDPALPRDRRALLEDAVDSEYESAKIRDRSARAARASAVAGRPGSRPPFGYRREYDASSRRLVRQVPVPAEAKVVRELFTRIAAGHTLRAIADDFEARGVRRRDGQPFRRQGLRDMATRAAVAGRRVHQPRDAKGRKVGKPAVYPGTWPAIVKPALYDRVQRVLNEPGRTTSRPGRANHWLSMIAVCDVCSGPIAAAQRGGRWCYWCRDGGHVLVPEVELNTLAESLILGYLSRRDVYEQLTARQPDDAAVEQLDDQLEAARRELDDLRDALGDGSISVATAARAEPKIEGRIAALEAEIRDATMPPALVGLIAPGKDVRARWRKVPLPARRTVARLLLTPEILGELRVTRSPVPGRPAPIEQRVVWRTTEGRIGWFGDL
jgi:DNA invertase Pin-like site-specific DNA recombinase